MVSTYHHNISSPLWEGKRYGNGQFFSPLKDRNEQTILVENSRENKNDSYRQRTKYDDQVDCYFSVKCWHRKRTEGFTRARWFWLRFMRRISCEVK